MITKGQIYPNFSPYSALILYLYKKTGEVWIYMDFWALNTSKYSDTFPIPYITGLINELGHKTVFFSLNLAYIY